MSELSAILENTQRSFERGMAVRKVVLWSTHLTIVQDNRKRGAAKAAQTRKKKGSSKVLCGYCKKCDPKDDKAETVEWIQCGTCDNWYHQVCALTRLDDEMFWHWTFCVPVNTM
ncbi:uncharacterized protein LOC111344713 [Stylophora pistillata]|uniref:uncharacterized protein LOC111344713 n=1 Tax=Stylophora pistillata TaxID=50429 RepID=UPI000C04CF4F|nr:uncharacterized protein LOC111344713 [Stylophora pistillata]